MPTTVFTLYQLNTIVKMSIEDSMDSTYWVQAELSECRESRGHCYMELIEKEEGSATPIARASAKCWRSQWERIRPNFELTTGQQLRPGMLVRLLVSPQFHELYGFSWIVKNIDATFSLGDMARKRQEIVRRLKADGVFDLQRDLQLPLFCQRIAVISSATAAGYGDFVKQLMANTAGLAFMPTLFEATMQGEDVEQSIIEQLDRIYGRMEEFDCVVIIRGGGGTADFSGFDTLALAESVAQFPLPIITGIGHDRDESVLDMVSHARVKTPTAAAALLIDHAKAVSDAIDNAQQRITNYAKQRLITYHSSLHTLETAIPRLFSVVKTRQEARIDQIYSRMLSHIRQTVTEHAARLEAYKTRLPVLTERKLTREKHSLELLCERMKPLDPQLMLRRGYSITTKDGHTVRDPHTLKKGDIVETRVEKGTIKSTVL